MARSVSELQAWASLLDLCEDESRVFATTPEMRSAVLEVERELCRLHKVEDAAIRLARLLKRYYDATDDSDEQWEVLDDLWTHQKEISEQIVALIPEAFTPEAMLGSSPDRHKNVPSDVSDGGPS